MTVNLDPAERAALNRAIADMDAGNMPDRPDTFTCIRALARLDAAARAFTEGTDDYLDELTQP